MSNNSIPKDMHFDILYNEALGAMQEFKTLQEKELVKLLDASTKDLDEDRTSSVDDVMERLRSRSSSMERSIEESHAKWIEDQASKEKQYSETPLLEYLWNNKPSKEKPLYYQQWECYLKALKLYRRLSEKDIGIDLFVVTHIDYDETPYSEAGELPLFLAKSNKGLVYFAAQDPVSDGCFVFLKQDNIGERLLTAWLSKETFRESYRQKMLASTPDKVQNAVKSGGLLYSHVGNDFDLHDLIVSTLEN